MIHDTQNAQISQKQDEHSIYVIMKTMCLPGYHHNGFVATHALGHMSSLCVVDHLRPLIYTYIYIYIYIYHRYNWFTFFTPVSDLLNLLID